MKRKDSQIKPNQTKRKVVGKQGKNGISLKVHPPPPLIKVKPDSNNKQKLWPDIMKQREG